MSIELRKYQLEGIELIKQKRNFGLFWQQRLGKTIVAIKAIEKYKKVIIAVPHNTITHWANEIIKYSNIKNLEIIQKSYSKRNNLYQKFNKSDELWIIGSYDTIAQDFLKNNDIINEFDYLILDEAHFLRNNKSLRSKGINKLRLKARYALALSGTPAVNSAIDLLRILKFLYPNSNFNHRYLYKKKFFHPVKVNNTKKTSWEIKPEMIDQWKQFISEMCDIKKVHDYLQWLPRNITKEITLEMNDNQRKHYNKMLIESKRIIKNKEKTEKNAMTQIIRLQQLCLDPRILNINAKGTKIEWLENYLNDFLLDQDEYVIVFTHLSSIYDNWDLKLDEQFSCAYLTGKTPNNQRQQIINDFQNQKIRVLFTNIKLAALGLTLDNATCTIFLDKSWNPIDNEQASFRMVDTKQKIENKPKLHIELICNNSIDQKINEVLTKKTINTSILYELEKYLLNEE